MRTYISSRGGQKREGAAGAIIQGIASDKGLFVPLEIPELECPLEDLADMKYKDVAKMIIGAFFDDYTKEEIEACVEGAYDSKFDAEDVVPVVKAGDAWFLELYRGKTSAFKDMALSILPYLLTTAVKKNKEDKKICILTATSGDTGKAALEGFADVPGTEIIVFFPEDGVSAVQKAQMVTQDGENTHVFAIRGNFDDAQTGVKKIFNDDDMRERLAARGYKLSSANSINVGRLVPQVAYYVYGYGKLIKNGAIKAGDSINIVVPTGNFGNILAAYYAGLMGVPVNKFICASNENKVLTDFINTGVYDTRREFHLTTSPSMDILISSNLERLLYHLSGGNSDEIARLMRDLDEKNCYEVSPEIKGGMSCFYGGFANMGETDNAIGDMYANSKYLMDTHTAVAYKVYEDYRRETGDERPSLIASTASPFKFSGSVAKAIGLGLCDDEFAYLENLSTETGLKVPAGLSNLDKKEVRHKSVIGINEMPAAVEEVLK